MSSGDSFFHRHKFLTVIGIVLLVLVLTPCLFLRSRARGPHHDYELDFTVPDSAAAARPGVLQVGVAKRDITPIMDLYDPWTDVNNNSKFDPDVDTYEDRNGNGRFDGVWMAGFNTNRPAKDINDPQWVRAMALRNNGVTLVLVTIDSIGIFHNEYVTIRKSIDPSLGIDHIMFSATHCHEVVDTMKIWSFWKRKFDLDIPVFGYNESYMEMLQREAKAAIEEAVSLLEPCDMYCAQVRIEPEGFVRDSRKPVVMDDHMYLWQFAKPSNGGTIATFVNYGNHPETLGSRNPLLSSDFVHYLRQGVENGVGDPNGAEGFGGMCLYFQGMIGGLMTQLNMAVPHRDGLRKLKDGNLEKTQALGENLAIVACNTLRNEALVWKNENPLLAVTAKTILAPMEGQYKWVIRLGLIHEGYYPGGMSKSEINVLRIGNVLILTTPGEIYPEIVEGGIEALPGRDFEIAPVEVPPLREEMEKQARMAFVIGLANDEIGYMVPKSQWDHEPPYVYEKSQYGEENSGGPDVAGVVHRVSLELLQRMNAAFPMETAAAN